MHSIGALGVTLWDVPIIFVPMTTTTGIGRCRYEGIYMHLSVAILLLTTQKTMLILRKKNFFFTKKNCWTKNNWKHRKKTRTYFVEFIDLFFIIMYIIIILFHLIACIAAVSSQETTCNGCQRTARLPHWRMVCGFVTFEFFHFNQILSRQQHHFSYFFFISITF